MNDLIFTPEAFKEYLGWFTEDKKTFNKINDNYRRSSLQREKQNVIAALALNLVRPAKEVRHVWL